MTLLKSDFVVGWSNIKKTDYVGYSKGYSKKHCAVGTTNGSGSHNVQIFVLAPDQTVIHALPGFWSPSDLARELRFAKTLLRLWNDESRDLAQKKDMYRRLQLAEVRYQPAETFALSAWQGFDSRREHQELAKTGERDTIMAVDQLSTEVYAGVEQQTQMKPINMVAHERMAARPFVPFAEFDVAEFIDYGLLHYDLNARHNKGKPFPQGALKRKRAIAEKKAQQQAAREARRKGRG